MNKPKLIVILGPTASGKTGWSIRLAKQFNGYIISADSQQIYKGMNIGTGKVTKKEMDGVKHYLLDILEPGQRFTVAKYQKMVQEIIEENPGKVPFLVGGTGLYIAAVVDNYIYPDKGPQLYDVLEIGIKMDRKKLYKKINKRSREHWDMGLVRETKRLVKKHGYPKIYKTGFVYKHVIDFLKEKIDKEEAIRRHLRDARRYAKRQDTWFRRDQRIKWMTRYIDAKKEIKNFIY